MMKDKIDEYTEYLAEVKKSTKNTIEAYRRDLYAMADYFMETGIRDAEKLTYTNINSYVLHMERLGKSVSTITRSISSMKTFFHYMLLRGYISGEPTELIEPPRVKRKTMETNSEGTIEKLLKQPKGDSPMALRDKAMLELIRATGMRVSELTDTDLLDINFSMNYVVCRNAKGERVIPFDKRARTALMKYLKDGREALVKDRDCKYIFVNCHGGKLSRQSVWKMVKSYAKEAGIEEDVTLHTLRRSVGAQIKSNTF